MARLSGLLLSGLVAAGCGTMIALDPEPQTQDGGADASAVVDASAPGEGGSVGEAGVAPCTETPPPADGST